MQNFENNESKFTNFRRVQISRIMIYCLTKIIFHDYFSKKENISLKKISDILRIFMKFLNIWFNGIIKFLEKKNNFKQENDEKSKIKKGVEKQIKRYSKANFKYKDEKNEDSLGSIFESNSELETIEILNSQSKKLFNIMHILIKLKFKNEELNYIIKLLNSSN